MSRLQEFYRTEAMPQIMERLKLTNPMAVPRISKITLNMGVGEALLDRKVLERAVSDLKRISGQQPVICNARISVATFKVRAGYPIGCKVTLRGVRMWEFFDRLVNVSLPRVRDFKGASPKAFDGRGNYSLGIREQIIFPEVNYDKIERITGMNVTICTSAPNDAEGKALLTHLGLPFAR